MSRKQGIAVAFKTVATLLMSLWAATSHATTELYYVHADHLGTPQVMTDNNQDVVWKRSQTPFGETVEETGTLEQPLRFPGQYEDRETGFHYNYFRDYEPSLGRYIQSDPIGLRGGFNTYGYTYQNPIRYTDPTGQAVFFPAVVAACAANPAACGVVVTSGAYVIGQAAGKVAKVCGDAWNAWNESSEDGDNSNNNPYNGPVDEPVIVVNGNGTGIPIGEGESIGSSPDGKWQEVKDRNGNRTGTRVDAGHPKTHGDPRARGAHGHRDGITNSDGTPWLPW